MTATKVSFAAICVVGVALVTQPKLHKETMATDSEFSMSLNNTYIVENVTHSYNISHATVFLYREKDQSTTTTTTTTAMPSYENSSTTQQARPLTTPPPRTLNFEEYIKPDTLAGKIIGHCLAVVAGSSLSLSVLIAKRDPYIKEHFMDVIFWSFLFNTVVSVVLMAVLENPVVPWNWFDMTMLAGQAVASAGAWFLFIYAPTFISGNTFTLILSTEVIFMLISQYTVLSSILPGHRNWIEVVGVVFVLLGSSLSSVFEMIRACR